MTQHPVALRSSVLAALLSTMLAACAAKPTVTCGAGTSEENGTCVPVTVARCKEGQALVGDACKPVCGVGTIYVGTVCTVADAACGPGTVLSAGQCTMADPLAGAVVREAPEPNDTAATATRVVLPAIGQPALVAGGTVGAPAGAEADFDGYVFTARAGDRLRIQLTAVGASSVGAVVEPVGLGGSLRRYIVAPSARGASRDIYLPVGGDWLLKVTDATNLDLFRAAFPRGGSDATYLAALSLVTGPDHRSLSVGATEGGDWKGPVVFDVSGASDAQLVNVNVRAAEGAQPLSGRRSVWMTDASGKFLGEELETQESGAGPLLGRFAVPPAGAVLGVDAVVDFGAGGAWDVSLESLSWTTVDVPFGGTGDLSEGGASIMGFDVAEEGVVRVGVTNIGYDLGRLTAELRDETFRLVGTQHFTADGALSGYVPAGAGGRHYLVFRDSDWQPGGTVYTFDWELTRQPVTTLALASVPGRLDFVQTLTDTAVGWYMLAAPVDAELTAMLSPSTPGTFLAIDAFDARMSPLTPTGLLDSLALLDGLPIAARTPVILRVTSTQAVDVTGSIDVYVPSVQTETEPNDQADQAASLPLESAGAVVVNGAIDVVADVDNFRFTLTGPATVRLLTRKVGDTSIDTILSLADETGATELDVSDDIDFMGGNLYSRIERALDPGTYIVRVRTPSYAFGDVSTTGPYQLSLRSTPIEAPAP